MSCLWPSLPCRCCSSGFWERAMTRRDLTAKIILYAILIAGLLVVVGPFLWMALSSIKPEAEIRAVPPTWLPHTFTLDHYRDLFAKLDFPRYFANSAIVAVLVTVGNLLF